MDNKYIIANIKLPIKVNIDGTYDILSDNIEIEFSDDDIGETKMQLNNLISNMIPLETKKISTNMSFKNNNKSNKLKNFTVKKNLKIL